MRQIMLRVAYDGTAYNGWQLQPGKDTIESRLNGAIEDLTGEKIFVIGASRTDAGVHSMGNVAVFSSDTKIPAEKLPFALNTRLPEDIRVMEAKDVDEAFHPRKANSRKTYCYKIENCRFPQPLRRYDSYFCHTPLDVEAMQKAAKYLIGEHDFGAFCSAGSQAKDTIRRIYDLHITKDGDMISIYVTGNGFLYNMVRIIAGTLIEVGSGRYQPQDVKQMLWSADRTSAGRKVPAKGLTMVSLQYEEEQYPQHFDSERWAYTLSKSDNEIYMTLERYEGLQQLSVLIGKLANHAYRDGASDFYLCVAKHESDFGENYHPGYFSCEKCLAKSQNDPMRDYYRLKPDEPLQFV